MSADQVFKSINSYMYEKPFFIDTPVSNNAFNFEQRSTLGKPVQVYVAALKTGTVDDVKIGTETVFEEIDEDVGPKTCLGLENFIQSTVEGVPAYIFDNHNHAFAFWCLEKSKGNLNDHALLIHIDQHKDTRTPKSFLSREEATDLSKVFQYTNSSLNVGNFIPAAQHIGLVGDIVFIDSEYSLQQMVQTVTTESTTGTSTENASHITLDRLKKGNIILDIDLDFFAPDSDYIGNELKVMVIKKLIPMASVITFATSPFFIDQERAITWLRRCCSLEI